MSENQTHEMELADIDEFRFAATLAKQAGNHSVQIDVDHILEILELAAKYLRLCQ